MLSASFLRTKANVGGLNCAQIVYSAFKEERGFTDEDIKNVFQYGTGRAPGGYCGALYIAKMLTDQKHHESLTKEFMDVTGADKCKKIRKLDRIPCNQCAALAVKLVKKYQ